MPGIQESVAPDDVGTGPDVGSPEVNGEPVVSTGDSIFFRAVCVSGLVCKREVRKHAGLGAASYS